MNIVCMYTPSADGGHAQYAWELMNALATHPRARSRFELVTSEDLEEQYRTDIYPVHAVLPPIRPREAFANRLSWASGRITHYARREWRFLNWLRGRPDVSCVHFQEWTPWLAAPLFRRIRRMGKEIFYTVHNVVPHRYPPLLPKSVMDGWIRRACLLTDGLFVHTDALAAQLAAFLGDPHPPIHVVTHGVWTVRRPVPAPEPGDRLPWKRLLFFGQVRRNKGLDLLLRAAELLPGYRLTVAGQVHDRDYFEGEVLPLVRRLRDSGVAVELQDQFVAEDEVPALFAGHSAVVLPYTSGFRAQSGVVFLALAHELPVVASEAGGLGELLAEFPIGIAFKGETPEALAGAIRELHENPPGGSAALHQQIRRAKDRYSWRHAAAATINGYYHPAPDPVRSEADDYRVAATTSTH